MRRPSSRLPDAVPSPLQSAAGKLPYGCPSSTCLQYRFRLDGALRSIYLKPSDSEWRVPEVNESCCKRPELAKLLDDVAAQGPSALYEGSRGQVSHPAQSAARRGYDPPMLSLP